MESGTGTFQGGIGAAMALGGAPLGNKCALFLFLSVSSIPLLLLHPQPVK